jgi:hypothetical protein
MARFVLLQSSFRAITQYPCYKLVPQFASRKANHNQTFCFEGEIMRRVTMTAVPLLALFRTSTILLLVMGLVGMAGAQGGGPERDAAAISTLQSALTAMGGVNGWGSIQDWTITGQVSTSGSGQTANFSWIGAGLEFRIEVDPGQTTNLFLSGHGSPARISNGTVSPLNYFVARANPPLYLPGVRVAQELNNQQLTLQYVGTTTANGVPAVQIHVCDNSDALGALVTPHDWYFNATTFLPLQVTVRLPPNENPAQYSNGTLGFGAFQAVNGLLVPFQVTLSNGNLSSKSFAIASVVFNSSVPQSEFDPPLGGGQ